MPPAASVLASLAAVVLGYPLLSRAFYQWALGQYTVLNELQALGRPRNDKKLKGTAVICGGSIAGLLAARVCADHFEDVVVIDPDNDALIARARGALPSQPGGPADLNTGRQSRARVMQINIIHVSQALNLRALERLFPEFREWLKTIRAAVGPAEWMGEYKDGAHVPPPREYFNGSIPEVFCTSRGAYETLLRHLVSQVANVRFVTGLITGVNRSSKDSDALDSVSYRSGKDSDAISVQIAQLVVDCTGPVHAGTTWLKRANFATPTKEIYDPHLRYYTAEYTVNPAIMDKIVPGGFNRSTPYINLTSNKLDRDRNAFAITQIEDDRIHVMSGGWGFTEDILTIADLRRWLLTFHQKHPQWLWGLLDYLEGEPEETKLNAVRSAGALHYNKYHEMATALPHNFVALGDASMRLNPVFGQGLTKAMIGAIVLDSCLHRVTSDLPSDFAARFFNTQHTKLSAAWDTTKYVDYQVDTTEPAQGETRASGAFPRWLFRAVEDLEIAGEPEAVRRKFELIHWIAPPTTFLAPTLLVKIAHNIATTWWRGKTTHKLDRQ